jgi:hypothetical protein
MARPSPTGPIFSAVLALTFTWSIDRASSFALAHRWNVRRHLGRLRDDGGVHIGDGPPAHTHTVSRLGQEQRGVGAAKGGVGVGEMPSDVAQGGRSQQGVRDGVQQGIGIRMP